MVTLEDGSIHTQRKTRTEGNQGSDQTFIVANFFFFNDFFKFRCSETLLSHVSC